MIPEVADHEQTVVTWTTCSHDDGMVKACVGDLELAKTENCFGLDDGESMVVRRVLHPCRMRVSHKRRPHVEEEW